MGQLPLNYFGKDILGFFKRALYFFHLFLKAEGETFFITSHTLSKHLISTALSENLSYIWKSMQFKENGSGWLSRSLEALLRAWCCHFSGFSSLLYLQKTSECQQPLARTNPTCKEADMCNGACRHLVPGVQYEHPAPWRSLMAHPALLPHLDTASMDLPTQQSVGK